MSPYPATFGAAAGVCASKSHGRGTATSFRTSETSTPTSKISCALQYPRRRVRSCRGSCRRSLNLFGWLRWTVMCNLPLHFCENPETRRYSNLDPIGEEQFLEGIASLAARQGDHEVGAGRPLWFEAGWPHNSEHYLAVFVCYELGGQPRCPLLAMAPLVQAPGQDLSAQGHVDFLRDMLSKTTVNLSKTASTWLSLLENFKDELAQVRDLMITLKSLNQSAKLRLKTKLRPVLNQATCWSSTFCIVNRYMKLLEFIQDGDDLAEYLPSPAANRTLRKLLEDLKKIESVSKELQSKSVSIADVRSYFDALIELWPEFATSSCCNVHNPHFEAGCVKVQRGESAELTRSEKAALSRFAVLEAVEQPLAADHETTGSFVEQVKKKRKTSTPTATYMLLQSVPPLQTDFVPSHERRAMGRERRQRVLLDWLLVKLLLLYC
ncbi:hypothetical protein GQ600_1672 [Phytophthora cactorum]|nr:hypothetical protein GQ600_1672 [Phytophthora cactorum]